MNLQQKAAKGVAWSAIENLGTQAIYFIIFLILARLLGPEVFGLVSLAGIFISLMMVFADQGLSDAIIQRQELEPEHLDTAFWTNLIVSIFLTVLTIVVAEPVSIFFKQSQLSMIICWLSLNFLFSGFSSVQQALLRRQFAFRALAVRSLLSLAIGGIVGVTMAYLGFGVWSLVCQQLINRLIASVVLWWSSDWRPKFRFSITHFQELFSFGINVLGGSVLAFFSIRSDDFLIGYFLGPVALGYYTVAYRLLVALTQILSTTIRQVAFPMFSRLQKETQQLQQAFFSASQLVSFLTFPACLGLAVLAPEIIQSLFGQQWLPSIPVMQILAFSGITHSLMTLSGLVIISMGKPAWSLGIMFLNTAINVIAFLIVVRWGIVAVAASFVLRDYLLSPIQFWVLHKLIRFDFFKYFYQFLAPLLASVVMIASILLIKYFTASVLNTQILLMICILGGVISYLTAIMFVAPNLFGQLVQLARLSLERSHLKKT